MMRQASTIKKAFLILLLFLPGILIAQEYTVSGKITDKNTGETLPGVNLLVKGTNTGRTSDIDGNFTINLSQPATLVFSYIGYGAQEIAVDKTQSLNVQLESSISKLDEVIIIGYGTQKKADKTGAVAHLTSEDLGQGALTDPVQGIQGKIAGVVVTKKGGDPNKGFGIRIRGAAGLGSNTQPLFVVDGIPNVDPTTIAPEDIESYSVLKDAASTAIYGSQGSNGVIIIKTKKGTAGKGNLQFNVKISTEIAANTIEMLSASDIRKYVADYGLNFEDGGADVDWQEEIYRMGMTQDYNLSYSGGNESSNYYASITHANWEGIMKGTEKERTIGKINLSHKALDDKLTVSGSLSASFENNDYENYDGWDKDDIIFQALTHNPTDPVKDENGDYYKTIRAYNYENPMAVIDGIDNVRSAKSVFSSFKTDLEILPGLVASVNLGYTRDDHESGYFRPKGSIYATADDGEGKKEYANTEQKLLELTGNYKKSLGLHNIDMVIGYSWQDKKWDGFYAQARNPQSDFLKYNDLGSFVDINSNSIASWAGASRLIGFFGRIQYNYNSKYYVSGSLRRDGSTKFGDNKKWGWFPTVSAGWNIEKESFMSSVSIINQLKIRASYGTSGNQAIGEYKSRFSFESRSIAVDPITGEKVMTFGTDWNENPDLQWESTTEINIGLDFAILKNRINGSIEVYTKYTDKLLAEVQVPIPPNLGKFTYFNTGDMRNKGIEVFLQAFIVDQSKIKWKSSLNVTHFKTIIGNLGVYAKEGIHQDGYLSGRGMVGDNNYVTGNIKGKELGAFYLPKYMGLSSDGVFLYQSTTGGVTRDLSKADRYIAGSPAPNLEIGWSNNFTFFKNFGLDFSLRGVFGNDVYNATRMLYDYPGYLPSTNVVPEALDWKKQGRTQGPAIADMYVEDGSFVRMDYITLSYNLNLKSKYIKSLRIQATSSNLFIITNYSGVDPETEISGLAFGIDKYDVYPKARTFTLGLSANF
jgi:TonB-linked SusC/RagA family outer membrane protein